MDRYDNYFKALKILREDKITDYHNFIKKEDLSRIEKKLLNARMLLRDQCWEEVIEQFADLKNISDLFYLAESNALVSYSFSMKGGWQEAIIYNEKAIFNYLKTNSYSQLYLAYYNTSIYYSRLGLLQLSNYYLSNAQPFSESKLDSLSINLAVAANLSKVLEYDKAIKILEEGLNEIDQVNDFEFVVNFKLVSVDIFSRACNYKKSKKILEELINLKKAPSRSRILFENNLILAILNEDFSMINWQDIILKDKLYSLKTKVIDYLLTGQATEAKNTWKMLAQLEPNNFLPEFEMKFKSDENSLFYVFVKKIKALNIKSISNAGELSGKLKLLHDILYESKFPLSKEELIERIWGAPYDPALDSRFYKLVQRLKVEGSCNVVNNHGGYVLM